MTGIDVPHPLRAAEDRMEAVIGGPARFHVVLVLACVLALNTADQATVGAAGTQLESGLRIGNTSLGILAAVAPLIGAFAAFPAGVLIDRSGRTRMLAGAVVIWSVAQLVSAFSVSFEMLLLSRLALGLVIAVAGPAVASLTGDFFPAGERGRVYGFILAGELVGAALGFLVTGEIAGFASWRWAFAALSLPGFALGVWIWRSLPEPARGGQSRLMGGETEILAAEDVESDPERADAELASRPDELTEREVRRQHVRPRRELVLSGDPHAMSSRQAVRYVLAVPSNVLLVIASALGYFFLEGLETFAVIYLERRYGIAHSLATLLLAVIVIIAVAGAVVGGRVADRLIARGQIAGRIIVAGVAYGVAAVALTPAFALSTLPIALLFYVIGALGVAAPNPPLDAARLDIMPAALWGRAEGVRTFVRNLATGLAPFLFGYISDRLASGVSGSGATGFGAGASASGLRDTFLIMLVPLLVSGLLMLWVMRTYPRDVATALANEKAAERATST